MLDQYSNRTDMHDTTFDDDPFADQAAPRPLVALLRRMQCTTLSTAFSGIDSPGTAFEQIYVELQAKLGEQLDDEHSKSRHLHAIEWEAHSQHELLTHPASPRCLFANIEGFLNSTLRSQLQSIVSHDRLQTVLLPVITENPNKAIQKPLGVIWHTRNHGTIAALRHTHDCL